MGFSVFKPRCAVPIGHPCTPVAGGSTRRQLSDSDASSSASDSEDDMTIPFDVQVFKKEQIFFQMSTITVVVVRYDSDEAMHQSASWCAGFNLIQDSQVAIGPGLPCVTLGSCFVVISGGPSKLLVHRGILLHCQSPWLRGHHRHGRKAVGRSGECKVCAFVSRINSPL